MPIQKHCTHVARSTTTECLDSDNARCHTDLGQRSVHLEGLLAYHLSLMLLDSPPKISLEVKSLKCWVPIWDGRYS